MKNLKKTLALVAALTMTAAVFAGCISEGGDTPADTTAAGGADTTAATGGEIVDTGDQLTMLGWNEELITWVNDYYFAKGKAPEGVTFNPVNFGVGAEEASAKYDDYFASGEDCDIYNVEAGWAMAYLDSEYAAAMSDIGIADSEFDNIYDSILAVSKDSNGVIKGATMQSCAGGWIYRADLADKYLGVKTMDEMQAKVSDWDKFLATAEELKVASNGTCTIVSSLDMIWEVYSSARSQAWIVDNKLVITDEVDKFLDIAKTMADNKYVDLTITNWSDAWYAVGKTDDTFSYFAPSWGFVAGGYFDSATNGGTSGDWKAIVGPQGWSWGGTWMVVKAGTDNPATCADIIRSICLDPESTAEFMLGTGQITANKAANEIAVAQGYENPLIGGQNHWEVLAATAEAMELVTTPYDAQVKSALQASYQAYVNPEAADHVETKEECIEMFKDKVAATITTLDWE